MYGQQHHLRSIERHDQLLSRRATWIGTVRISTLTLLALDSGIRGIAIMRRFTQDSSRHNSAIEVVLGDKMAEMSSFDDLSYTHGVLVDKS